MRDFTLDSYRKYLQAIKSSYENIFTFSEYFLIGAKPERFCLVGHGVDRKPQNALAMAKLENEMGIRASYYFRARPHTFKPKIIAEIAGLGHEIGYHYESLSDANGNMSVALKDFENNLNRFREIVPIQTISMHGSPLKPYDNRDMWRDSGNRNMLTGKYGILGEVYVDIDYTSIAYITDTGRNWKLKHNIRDRVISSIKVHFEKGEDLLECLKSSPYPKMVFQVHPERWTNTLTAWITQYFLDAATDAVKDFLR